MATYDALAKLGDGGLQGDGQLIGSVAINVVLVALVFKAVCEAHERRRQKLLGEPSR